MLPVSRDVITKELILDRVILIEMLRHISPQVEIMIEWEGIHHLFRLIENETRSQVYLRSAMPHIVAMRWIEIRSNVTQQLQNMGFDNKWPGDHFRSCSECSGR